MSQSKRHSAIETATNTAVGFVGSYFITLACFHVPDANLATKTLYATLGCTAWSLLRGYYLRRLFNHLHVKRTVGHLPGSWTVRKGCEHLYVSGFGQMHDAVVCVMCGICKYPEAAPDFGKATKEGRVILENHPHYEQYAKLARQARDQLKRHEEPMVRCDTPSPYLQVASGVQLDRLGMLYKMHREPAEPDSEFRKRVWEAAKDYHL